MHTIPHSRHYGLENRFSFRGLLAVVGLHVVVAVTLLSMNMMPTPPQLTTLMVRVIQSESSDQDKAAPPIPKPAVKLPASKIVPLPQPQTVAVETAAPSPADAMPMVKDAPPPAVAEAAITQPRFDTAYLDNPAPLYPVISRRMREQGTVLLRVFVEPNGRPNQIQVSAGSGSHRLDQAAQEAVWRWKFVPARSGSEAVGAWVLIPVVFSLRG